MKKIFYRQRELQITKELSDYDTVVITGGSSGIGAEFLRTIRKLCNAPICNISRTQPDFLNELKDVVHLPCDLSNLDELKCALPKILEFIKASSSKENPRLLLINNAGFGSYGEFPQPNIDRNLEMIRLNVSALTFLCGELLNIIKAGKGSIVNISSIAAYQPCPILSVYAATKSYVKSFSLALAYELKKYGCKCLCVCPGPTSSNFFRAAGFDSPPLAGSYGHIPADVVMASLSALSKGKKLVIVGVLNKIQCLIIKFLPENFVLFLSGIILERVRRQ